ncbi:MAG: carboxylesterase family protein [Saccharofermentans sp.]|nr:carboxylesterase family protein [Saccharofermentans sp.]
MNEIINTKTGKVKGILEGDYYCFRGIPYAYSRRFMAPEDYCWDDVLDCTKYGPKAMQVISPEVTDVAAELDNQSENCQNLNIYVPSSINEGELLPVLLEIHGGAYQNGSNRDGKPENMVRDNKYIYVNINYRLGVLGYLYLGHLLGERYQTSANNGLLDQLAAVRWVFNNIESFGGDSHNITVMGASAGGKSIGALMMLPEFDKYVNKLIISSGAVQSIRSVETSVKTTNRFVDILKSELNLEVSDILTMPARDIINVQKIFCDNPGNTCMFGPVADGIVIDFDWNNDASLATSWNGRCLIGTSRNELGVIKYFDKEFLSKAPEISDYLFGANSSIAKSQFDDWMTKEERSIKEQEDMWVKILTDYMYRLHSHRLAMRLSSKGSKVWQYSIELLPAFHCADQNLAFNPPEASFTPTNLHDVAIAVGDKIRSSFVNFIINGTPGVEGWERFSSANPKVMFWDENSEIETISSDYVLTDFPDEVYKLVDYTNTQV